MVDPVDKREEQSTGDSKQSIEHERFKFEIMAIFIFTALLAFLVGLALAFNRGPQITSSMIAGSIIAYLVAALVFPRTRWVPLMLTLGLHIGAILSYYFNPIILPLVIIERWGERSTINIDVVQIILAYEIASSTLKIRRRNITTQMGEEPAKESAVTQTTGAP